MNVVKYIMVEKNVYLIQPYHVGNKDRKSLAMILPAHLTKQLGLSPSTIIIARIDNRSNDIILRLLNLTDAFGKNSAGEAIQTTHQQSFGGVR